MKKSILFAATAAALVLAAAAPAYAVGNSKGQEKRVETNRSYEDQTYTNAYYNDAPRTVTTRDVYFDNTDRTIIRDYMGRNYSVNCPTGQTISPNGCVPIGKMHQTVQTTTTTYTIGQPLAETVVYSYPPEPLITQLRPVPVGYEYVVVDGDVVLLAPDRQVIDAVTWMPVQ